MTVKLSTQQKSFLVKLLNGDTITGNTPNLSILSNRLGFISINWSERDFQKKFSLTDAGREAAMAIVYGAR